MSQIVYTGGTFDLFHSGHVNFLRRCSEIGEVTVAINSDDFVFRSKGKLPIMNLQERMQVLSACKYVTNVIENFGDEDSKPVILSANPNYIAIGSDWARKNYYQQMNFTQDFLDLHNIGLIYIPYTRDISSTNLKQRVRDQKNSPLLPK